MTSCGLRSSNNDYKYYPEDIIVFIITWYQCTRGFIVTYTPGDILSTLSSASGGLFTKYLFWLDFFTKHVYSIRMAINSNTIIAMPVATPMKTPILVSLPAVLSATAIVITWKVILRPLCKYVLCVLIIKY